MKKRFGIFLLVSVLLSAISFAHGGWEDEYNLNPHDVYPLNHWEVVGYGAGAFLLLVLVMMATGKHLHQAGKKVLFTSTCILCALVTLYLILTTIHLNATSWSKGPVHWHADFEIWACDSQISLVEPTGFTNKQGTDLLHAHDDNRMHIEGVLLNERAASLGAFFHALDGKLTNTGFVLPSRNGMVSVENGQACNGIPAKLYMFVNGNLASDFPEYSIAHFENVPPGDRIKIIFTEKPIDQINPYIAAEPMPENS
jgi:hypothetical protein